MRSRKADADGVNALFIGISQGEMVVITDLFHDGQSQSCSSKLAARSCVGLLESLEDDALLLGCDTDSGIFHFERDDRSGAIQNRVAGVGTSPAFTSDVRLGG